MRSTRATGAIERLNTRAETKQYSMVRTSSELFFLVQRTAGNPVEKLSEPLPLDEFVAFVNAYGPQKPKRVSKLDVAFEKQLVKKDKE
ncbi:hypothetical protein hmeg3_15405 [Herbaspirillum sp. meg3]|jgi:hypothetical protein|uniref:hypothetical protein n=1 Tax=Herbaspirillum sp. meg3 TaxID=2025949 RepID=UPI000B99C6DF|nr:hypothetical protein [Herbaspirillum sp. meg3]ASU39534.1 hypothetical protein hmeg3_15405 [Herbaspirillum sp. meg3]